MLLLFLVVQPLWMNCRTIYQVFQPATVSIQQQATALKSTGLEFIWKRWVEKKEGYGNILLVWINTGVTVYFETYVAPILGST